MTARYHAGSGRLHSMVLHWLTGLGLALVGVPLMAFAASFVGPFASAISAALALFALFDRLRPAAAGGVLLGASAVWSAFIWRAAEDCAAIDRSPTGFCETGDLTLQLSLIATMLLGGLACTGAAAARARRAAGKATPI